MPLLNVPSSTGPAVRAWLYSQCNTYVLPDTVDPDADLLICYDEPGPNQPNDIVAIGEVSRSFEFSSFVGGGGTGWLAERYTITITVDVYRGGDDANAVYVRGQAICDLIVAICRTDPTAGGNVLKIVPHHDGGHGEWDPEFKGRHWLAELVLDCYQRI